MPSIEEGHKRENSGNIDLHGRATFVEEGSYRGRPVNKGQLALISIALSLIAMGATLYFGGNQKEALIAGSATLLTIPSGCELANYLRNRSAPVEYEDIDSREAPETRDLFPNLIVDQDE